MKDIDYKKMAEFYGNIINHIFGKIDEIFPSNWDEQEGRFIHSEQYMLAYSYFQKAFWRLGDVNSMKDYYNDEHFEDFGLEHLSDARHRIENYLQSDELTISFDDDEVVQNYTYYDDVIIDYYQPIRINRDVHHDYFMYYQEILYRDSNINNIEFEIEHIKHSIETLKDYVEDSNYLLNKSAIQPIIKELCNQIDKIKIEKKEIKKEDTQWQSIL